MPIIPIPTTRVSDQFVLQRLLSQVNLDQLALFRAQNAISTGKRLTVPSDDAAASLRAIGIQGLLERKAQVKTNLATNQSYLAATDSALSQLGERLAEARALAIGATGATVTSTERAAAASQVNQILEQIADTGNQVFRGRYLFAGSRTTQPPFARQGSGVEYFGDRASLVSFSDIDLLFETNVTGDSAFGAISAAVEGSVDLNPALNEQTRLVDLRRGEGIRPGSISISDGNSTQTIDISPAATIGDVARLLESNPPAGRQVTARVGPTGLVISLDAGGGGNLTIDEVGGGTTAVELGIQNTLGVGVGPLVGNDLDPRLTLTTRLTDILGVKARAILQASGAKNDIVIESALPGPAFSGVQINLVDSSALQAAPGLTAGNEQALYSPTAVAARASLKLGGPANDLILTANSAGTAFNNVAINIVNGGNIGNAALATYNFAAKTLTLSVDDSDQTTIDALIAAINAEGTFLAARDASAEANVAGGFVRTSSAGNGVANTRNTGGDPKTLFVYIESGVTTANNIVAAIRAEGTFTAWLDKSEILNNGGGAVLDTFADPLATAVTSGGSGVPFDKASGVQIVNGGRTHTLSFATAETIEDVLNTLHGAGAGLAAAINARGDGLDIRTRVSGSDFSIGENGGTTATQLGVRSFSLSTPLSQLNLGRGVGQTAGTDLIVHRRDGVDLDIDLAGSQTIGDVLSLINNHPLNASGAVVTAQLTNVGNGILLLGEGPPGTDVLSVRGAGFSQPARDLGLVPEGAATSAPPVAGTAANVTVASGGLNNDLVFTASSSGTLVNGVVVRFVDTGLGAGNETVVYDPLGKTLTFDIDQASTTANRVVAVLAASPAASPLFSAALSPADGSPNNGSGLVGLVATGALSGGTADTIAGRDTNPLEVRGIFTALVRLQAALEQNDLAEIERSAQLLDDSTRDSQFARAELGARQQGLDVLETRLEDEEVELRRGLSLDLDVDLAAAISEFSSRQAALEASLRATGLITRLSLLDFL